LPDDVLPTDLDRGIRKELDSLPMAAAEDVARHLVMAGRVMDDDPQTALLHARAARRRAGRVAAVREAVGIAAYLCGEWTEALSELRAVRRMTGANEVVPMLADCERALGRPERALDLLAGVTGTIANDLAIELLLVQAGARSDLGQDAAALALLRGPAEKAKGKGSHVARLRYAYADILLDGGDTAGAAVWFARALDADVDSVTDAAERVEDLLGVVYEDLDEGEDEESVEGESPSA
jgi:hypothetical protein